MPKIVIMSRRLMPDASQWSVGEIDKLKSIAERFHFIVEQVNDIDGETETAMVTLRSDSTAPYISVDKFLLEALNNDIKIYQVEIY